MLRFHLDGEIAVAKFCIGQQIIPTLRHLLSLELPRVVRHAPVTHVHADPQPFGIDGFRRIIFIRHGRLSIFAPGPAAGIQLTFSVSTAAECETLANTKTLLKRGPHTLQAFCEEICPLWQAELK